MAGVPRSGCLIRCLFAGAAKVGEAASGVLSAIRDGKLSAATALCFFMNSQARPNPAATRSTMPAAVRDADLIAASLISKRIASSKESQRVD